MKRIFTGRFVLLVSLCLAGGVLSQKAPEQVHISQMIQNNSRLMTLEWKSLPGLQYAVETSNGVGEWTTITAGLKDPTAAGTIKYPIPDKYLFDMKRFFRVRTEHAK